MSADQVTKLTDQLILLTNAFLDPVLECEKKTHIYYITKKAVSKAVRKWWTRTSYTLFLGRQY